MYAHNMYFTPTNHAPLLQRLAVCVHVSTYFSTHFSKKLTRQASTTLHLPPPACPPRFANRDLREGGQSSKTLVPFASLGLQHSTSMHNATQLALDSDELLPHIARPGPRVSALCVRCRNVCRGRSRRRLCGDEEAHVVTNYLEHGHEFEFPLDLNGGRGWRAGGGGGGGRSEMRGEGGTERGGGRER
jgi:hypothetical protein